MPICSRNTIYLGARAALLSVGSTTYAVATDTVSTTALPAIVISADWLGAATPEAAKVHPGARTVVTERDLTESGARTLDDALRQVPGIRVLDESGTGILPNIGARGLNPLRSEQVLVLVDGIPVTLAPYGQTGLSLFPLTFNSVEAIDVARGGVAVHYGPNNVGGVVNFITKRIPRDTTVTAKETLSFAGGNMLHDTYFRAAGFATDELGVQLQANMIGGEGERDHSKTSVRNAMLDANWFISERADIKLGLQRYTTDNDLPGALTPRAYDQNREQSTRPLDRFVGDTTRGHVIYNYYSDNGAEFSWTHFAHRSQRQFFFGNSTNASTPSTLEQSSPRDFWVYGSEPKLTLDVNGALKQKIALGARLMREEVDYKVDSRNLATGAYSVNRDWRFENDAYAAYLSDTLSLLGDKLKITPGIRREQVYLNYKNNQTGATTEDETSDWLPGLDIGYQPTERVFLFTNYHESLRPVQFTQIVYNGSDLTAERAKNYELGIRVQPSRTIDTSLAAFRFDFDNKLEFVNSTVGFRNLGKARHEGVELELGWRPQAVTGLELKTAYTYVDTEQLSGQFQGKELPLSPHHQLSLQSNYHVGRWNWNLNGSYQSASFSDGANTETENATGSVGKIPSYWLWNMQLAYRFGEDKRRGARVAVAVNNLLDRDYYFRGVDYSQGRMPAPGRTLLTSLQMDW